MLRIACCPPNPQHFYAGMDRQRTLHVEWKGEVNNETYRDFDFGVSYDRELLGGTRPSSGSSCGQAQSRHDRRSGTR